MIEAVTGAGRQCNNTIANLDELEASRYGCAAVNADSGDLKALVCGLIIVRNRGLASREHSLQLVREPALACGHAQNTESVTRPRPPLLTGLVSPAARPTAYLHTLQRVQALRKHGQLVAAADALFQQGHRDHHLGAVFDVSCHGAIRSKARTGPSTVRHTSQRTLRAAAVCTNSTYPSRSSQKLH